MKFYEINEVLLQAKKYECDLADEVGGFSVHIATFYDDKANGKAKSGTRGTPAVLYVVGTNTERVGTDSDESIVISMLNRGYIVVVADFLDDENTTSPKIDWSVDALIQKVKSGEFFTPDSFEEGTYWNSYIVPSGYDISLGNVFWQIDRHSVVGTMEKIVFNWNTDLRGCKGDYVIPWVHEDGTRKATQADFEGNLPVWYADPKGEIPDERGIYIRVKHTKAERITDCIRPDGYPIDLNLYMYIVYPTNPKKKVPMMVLASSSEHLGKGATMEGRPHIWSFTFMGYAFAAYDYAYVPMVRNDHYGYYDGYKWSGWKTGDNMTYSVYTYNMQLVSTAAIRYLRRLAYRGELPLNDTFGIVGNSKGSEMTHLGAADLMQPLSLSDYESEDALQEAIQKKISKRPPRFYMPNHHGETRYEMRERGYSADGIEIHDGAIQPWLTHGEREIPSGVQFVYSCCGAIVWTMDENYPPMFISGSMGHGETSVYTRQNEVVNLTREYNIPLIYFESYTGHGLIPNEHHLYPVDPYAVYKNFVNYFLNEGAVTVGYANPVEKENLPRTTVPAIHFAGVVPMEEAKRITLTDERGNLIPTTPSSKWGDTYWEFTPERLAPDNTYTLTVPEDLRGANGKTIGTAYTHTFRTAKEEVRPLDWSPATLSVTSPTALTPITKDGEVRLAFYVENDARSAVKFYSTPECTEDTLLATVPLMGRGKYELTLPTSATVYLKQRQAKGEYPIPVTGVYGLAPKGTGYGAVEMREGIPSFRIAVGLTLFNLGHATYGTFECLTYKNIIGRPLVAEDYGRAFRLTFRVYDTVSRQFVTVFHSMSSPETQIRDYRVARKNYTTKANESVEYTFDFTLYHPSHGEVGLGDKYLSFHINPTGDTELPLYFSDFTLTETVTDVEISYFEQLL